MMAQMASKRIIGELNAGIVCSGMLWEGQSKDID